MYIRTKNGIIDLNRIHLDGSPIYNLDTKENVIKANENGEERDCYYIENDTIYGYWYLDGCIWEEHIIKQSDNLADLCDLYVDKETKTIFHKHNGYLINWRTNLVYSLEEVAKNFYSVKGAIWTDKGLIYVAKIGNEGKLVLI